MKDGERPNAQVNACDRATRIVSGALAIGLDGAGMFIALAEVVAAQNPKLARESLDAMEGVLIARRAGMPAMTAPKLSIVSNENVSLKASH